MPAAKDREARRKPAPRTETMPVLPVRDAVHFPGMVNTLHVAREVSLQALRKAMDGNRLVLVLSQKDMSLDDPKPEDLYGVGTVSEILQSIPLPDTTQRAALRGLERAKVTEIGSTSQGLWAKVQILHELPVDDLEIQALMRACVDSFTRVVHLDRSIPPEALQSVVHADEAGSLTDAILHHAAFRPGEKQELLEELDLRRRLEGVMMLLKREEQVLVLNEQIHQKVQRELGESQREFYLREQLRVIEHELREREDRLDETEEYTARVRAAGMSESVEEAILVEVRRLDRSPATSPEGLLVRTYLDTVLALPWSVTTEDTLDVNAAERLLDERHFGLNKVKDRILDYLAVRQLKRSLRGPILCFVGPPGVGKTSLGRSIADAMGRNFIRISLGGVRDEAEIRGHRRTYVGSMPGRIVKGLRDCGSRNPVILLDEIDKISGNGQGDPAHALLEALDAEQNSRFLDHYIDHPFDLGTVLFIATANLYENIPHPLRDRMEVIHFPSYTDRERLEIARRYLWPRALREHGLAPDQAIAEDEAINSLVLDYTREAGVRDLQRSIAAVCRKTARAIASGNAANVKIDVETLDRFLGRPRNRRIAGVRRDEIGTAWSLVVSEIGGEVVPIEVSLTKRGEGRGELRLTGNLGQVMKESAQAALTAVQAQMPAMLEEEHDVHIHVPEGAVPKEGPSAGVTIACAIASALQGRSIRCDTAMTGEITLRGRILAVGGVQEKVLAAHRVGIRQVLIPKDNLPDLADVPDYVLKDMEILPVESIAEAMEASFA